MVCFSIVYIQIYVYSLFSAYICSTARQLRFECGNQLVRTLHYTTLHMRSLEHLACRKNEDLLNQTYHFIVYYLFIHLLLLRMWILIQHMYVHIFKWDCVGMIANRKKIYRKITILYHITLHYIVFYSIRFDSHIVKV